MEDEIVKLNIGGKKFLTTRSTLLNTKTEKFEFFFLFFFFQKEK